MPTTDPKYPELVIYRKVRRESEAKTDWIKSVPGPVWYWEIILNASGDVIQGSSKGYATAESAHADAVGAAKRQRLDAPWVNKPLARNVVPCGDGKVDLSGPNPLAGCAPLVDFIGQLHKDLGGASQTDRQRLIEQYYGQLVAGGVAMYRYNPDSSLADTALKNLLALAVRMADDVLGVKDIN